MSDTESFETTLELARTLFVDKEWSWGDKVCAFLKHAHDREIRDVSQQQYDRGFNDGRHSMDAEHRAVALRLRALPMNRVEYDANLHDIIEAVCGTNKAGDVDLRDKLIDLMGGVSDDGCTGCDCAAADCDGDCGLQREEVTDERLADDCAAHSRGGTGSELIHMDGLVAYDVLWNERRKAIANLRKWEPDKAFDNDKCGEIQIRLLYQLLGLGGAMMMDGADAAKKVRDRLIHLLGGDQPSGIDVLRAMDANGTTGQPNGTCPDDVPMASITDELREWAKSDVWSMKWDEFNAIADRIDEQFDRICEQQEAVLQSTIDGATHDVEMWRDRAEDMRMERDDACVERDEMKKQFAELCVERADLLELLKDARDEYMELQAKIDKANGENKGLRLSIDEQKEAIAQRKKTIRKFARDNKKVWKTVHELQAKVDEYDSTHTELPRDKSSEVFRVGCTVRMVGRNPEVLLTVHSMTLCEDGEWRLYACDDKNGYSCNLSTSEFEVCEKPQDTLGSIVHDLIMNNITESQAVERIEALNG